MTIKLAILTQTESNYLIREKGNYEVISFYRNFNSEINE